MIIDCQHHYRTNGKITADLATRLKWMDENEIDYAVLTTPRGGKDGGKSTWYEWNDELTEVEKQAPDRIVAAPAIPIFDGKSAVEELERVASKNEARAVFIQPLNWRIDQDYLSPFYEKLDDLRIPIFFHPVHYEVQIEGMHSAIGFPFNTTMAISCVLTSGLLDSCRHLKFVLPHLGGGLPFILGRLEIKYKDGEYRASRPPADYFDSFYFDVVAYSMKAFEFAASVLGVERLVYGTDYGCPGKSMVQPKLFKSFVDGLPTGNTEKQRIFAGQNLANMLKIEVSKEEERTIRAAPFQKG
jgi:predicted TIM-barrel fold metal-dependent hydrolase